MIESNIRNLSRMELVYCCIEKCVKYLVSIDACDNKYLHYLDRSDYNNIFYRNENNTILEDAYELSKRTYDLNEFRLLRRCLDEQTIYENDSLRLKGKNEGIPSTALQNPADPDSTFRKKLNSKHKGYSANIVESADINGSVITDYSYDTNIHSDINFAKEYLLSQDIAYTEVIMVSDGGYASDEVKQLASSKNIKHVTTNMLGTKPDRFFSEFEVADNVITKCPNGIAPITSTYDNSSAKISTVFEKTQCENCPHRTMCNPRNSKNGTMVTISAKTIARARDIADRDTEYFRYLSKLRNGVETIPSLLRNKYFVDRMPVRGKIKTKFFFGCMIGAINFNKLYRFRQGSGNYAKNPILNICVG